jgi:signal transduction histidine kinase/ActR/RegA family two-component response regulator
MIAAPLPIDEAERLEALASYKILDTPAEEGFDDLTFLVAQLLGTPIALVSLIDGDRQWFKSHYGLDAVETPRHIAFCAHAIALRTMLLVPDSRLDPRFSDNPLVVGAPGIRFYVGVPLINPEGYALGTLCGIDLVPRILAPQQIEALQRLGRQAMTQLELRRARDAALKSAAAKSEFLSTMSHEIRTPLNGVIGMTDLLSATSLDAEQTELAAIIKGCGKHLLAVIDDVLNFSKLESGKLSLERTNFDLGAAVAQAESIVRIAAAAKGIGLIVEGTVQRARRLGDPTRLGQVLLNLLANAVKFTDAGQVTLRFGETSGERIRFTVSDTGIGMTRDTVRHLFEKFSQADTSTTRRFGGTGLGLAITHRIVTLMGGTVSVTSTPGVGSTFTVELPLPSAESTPRPGARNPIRRDSMIGLKLLVAEDNAVNQLLIKRLLARLGCEVTIVASGRAARDRCAAEKFDAILMDCQMPDMDGYEASRQIRASGLPHAAIPIIAVTASALETDREQCLRAGMNEFLTKPVIVTQLEAALVRLKLSLRGEREAGATTGDIRTGS